MVMRHAVAAALAAVLILGSCLRVKAEGTNTPVTPTLLTNLSQVRLSARQKPLVVHPFRIVADVLDVDAASGTLVLRDSSGIEFIQLDLQGRDVKAGTTVSFEGKGCGFVPKGIGLACIAGMVVDNDGIHATNTESGSVFLHTGVNPIAVQWFNRLGNFGLSVEYEGPGFARQEVPTSELLRSAAETVPGKADSAQGLKYRCYEGTWGTLPDFSNRHPVKTGVATGFDLGVRTRNESVGLVFDGFITVPRDGYYTFYLTSDDGSRLLAGESSLDIRPLGSVLLPQAADRVPGTSKRNRRPWLTLDGTVKFAGVRGTAGALLIRVGDDDLRVEIPWGSESAPILPVDTKVRVSGFYRDLVAEDGSPIPGMLLVASWNSIHRLDLPEKNSGLVVGGEAATPTRAGGVQATASAPLITTAAEVKTLPAEEAKQKRPVSIRGVVTALLPPFIHGAVVQDSTKGVYVALQELQNQESLQIGEYCQVDGVTGPGLFAPSVVAHHIQHLGAGQWPQPLHATWDQLINGSLDTQYAEIDGVVTGIRDQQLEVLTEGGKITLVLSDFDPDALARFENDLVRIRGCAFAFFNDQTRELEPNILRVLGGAVQVLEPAPQDLFDAPRKSIGELLLYDPKAAPLRRLKVAGQITFGRAGEFFLNDGTNGLRVTTHSTNSFAPGDIVEAVGFLDLAGPAAELKEAMMRRTGRAPLPEPVDLASDRLLQARYDGTLVQVNATLMNEWKEGSEDVLDLQSGFIAFRARVVNPGRFIPASPVGSRLQVTGVYAPLGSRAVNGTVSGFELLLRSPLGIRVIATPPWWTLKRVLVLAGILTALLCAVLVWNKELQWKVQVRSRQLESEVRNRQQAELRHAAEAERSRIARDLHDELGTGLTEVTLLASTGAGNLQLAEKANDRLRVIADKSRALVSSLDVIVWAIDPKRNSLQSFADYLGRYATELFSASNIACRFKIPIECEAVTLSEPARHSLFLAVKEALNNVIRHASATEVEIQIAQLENWLQIVIADNGEGFDPNTIRRGNGLANLDERLKLLHGECDIESHAGTGTKVTLRIPLPSDST